MPRRVATNYQPRDIKRKQRGRQNEGTDKTKPRHSENKDHCCPSSGTPLCFSSSRCQPLRILTLREHQRSLTWQLKLSNAAEWEQAPPEGEAPRGDCGFTIEEREHLCLKAHQYPCREKPSPLNRHVFMILEPWLTANLIAFSYITALYAILNAQTERGGLM